MKKRLFIFAAYDKDSIIDDTLIYYIKSLSLIGDIVFIMDNDVSKQELSRIKEIKNVLYVDATRHNEYDFGSYKRGYLWVYDKKIIKNYNWVYFVNDSVYGPLWNIEPLLQDLESRKVDMIGLFENCNKNIPCHIQSWFLGIKSKIVEKDFIKDFMNNICHQKDKRLIVLKYEVRFSQIIVQNGYKYSAYYTSGQNKENICAMYECPLYMLEKGIPFIKKRAFKNINDIQFLYQYTDKNIIDCICNNAIKNKLYTPRNIKNIFDYEYKKFFRLTFLSVPIITIYKQYNHGYNISYKIYLFDKFPIIKIATIRNKQETII